MKESPRPTFETLKPKRKTTENMKMRGLRNVSIGIKDSIHKSLKGLKEWNERRQFISELGNSKNLGKIAARAALGGIAAMAGSDISIRPAYAQEARDTEWREPECFSFDGFSEKGLVPLHVEKIDEGKISLTFSGYPEGQETTLGRDLYEVTGEGLDEFYGPYGIPNPMDQYNTAESEVDFTRLPDGREAVLHVLKTWPRTPTLIFDGQTIDIGEPLGDVSHDLNGQFLLTEIVTSKYEPVRIPADNPTTYEHIEITNPGIIIRNTTETVNPNSGKKELWLSADNTGSTPKLYYYPETDTGWGDYETFPYNSLYSDMWEPNFTQDGTIMFFAGRFESGGELFICVTDRSGAVDADEDGIPATEDCNDNDVNIGEATDGTCDGDGDGEIDATAGGSDCDDANAQVGSSKPENCTDGIDNDCDTKTDAADSDCDTLTDNDGDGVTEEEGDCDDSNNTIYPGADEYCDTADRNCDGSSQAGAVDATDWYNDKDDDGYGDPTKTQEACDKPIGYVADNTDCNDNDGNVNPGKSETPYNGKDDDCNAATLDDDLDRDGYIKAQDCNDGNPDINPGESEVTYDGIDNDCNSNTLDDDLDRDGYNKSNDCNDEDSEINPGESETEYDGKDNDCNSDTHDDDLDADGFPKAEDCNDDDPAINPDAVEIDGNTVDENCDGDYGVPADSSGDIDVWSENPGDVEITGTVIQTNIPNVEVIANAPENTVINTPQGQFTILTGSPGLSVFSESENYLFRMKTTEDDPVATTFETLNEKIFDVLADTVEEEK